MQCLAKLKGRQGLRDYVLLLETGQTTNYQLYTIVSVKRWNVPGFQISEFCSQLHSALLCPAPFNKEQSTVKSFWTSEKAEEAAYPWFHKLLLGRWWPSCLSRGGQRHDPSHCSGGSVSMWGRRAESERKMYNCYIWRAACGLEIELKWQEQVD